MLSVCFDALSNCFCCGQTAGWIKMALVTEVGHDPGHIVLEGDPAPFQKRVRAPPSNFGPFLLWPKGSMHEDATWCGGSLSTGDFVLDGDPGWMKTPLGTEVVCRPRPKPHCFRRGPSYPRKWHSSPPFLRPISSWSRSSISATAELMY